MTRPPSSVKIGGLTWQILVAAFRGDETLYGRTDSFKSLIQLAPDQSPSNLRVTFLHELLHACLASNVCDDKEDDDSEERLVRRWSSRYSR